MTAKKSKLIILLLLSLITVIALKVFWFNNNNSNPYDVSRYVERLGIPYRQQYKRGDAIYARNVWDLQSFDGKLYIAAGNSSNRGPAPNAGEVPVIYWNPKLNKFESEFTVDEEQIDTFYILNQDLYIPGHDPTQSWRYGNIYRLGKNQWQKYRNIPHAIHVYALSATQKLLFAGLSINTKGEDKNATSAIGISTDWGKTWKNIEHTKGFRLYEFLKAQGLLYSTDMFLGSTYNQYLSNNNLEYIPVYEFNQEGINTERADLSTATIFPGFYPEGFDIFRIAKPQQWRSGTVYIGGKSHNDHQYIPFGVFYAADLRSGKVNVRQLPMPTNTKAWDLLIHNDVLYVLLENNQQNKTEVKVIATTDMQQWQTILQFSAPTFARSFEILNGDFYFGLGCEVKDPLDWQQKELLSQTGQILRVTGKHFQLLK
ncbi:hypothetical protein NIES4102_01080 [Chondrocystis sp. NIES-4102]|nr:hypothetical protein NIES4102_01080 [Chondrocystis sp. NIES-4102]